MTTDAPALARVPDARRGAFRLFDPVLLAYLALILGGSLAGLLGVVNGVALRRPRLALTALGLAVASWLGFWVTVEGLSRAGVSSAQALVLAGRLVHMAAGGALAWSQWAHLRGHQFLDGRVVSTLGGVVMATAAFIALPWQARLWLWGLPAL